MIEYKVFDVYTETSQVEKKEGEFLLLENMYNILKCERVEFLFLKDNQIMIIDEEGKLKNDLNNINMSATEVVKETFKDFSDFIAGYAILINQKYIR